MLIVRVGTPQHSADTQILTSRLMVPDLMPSVYSWGPWALALVSAVFVRAIFRRYWTSIRDVPGPLLASFSTLWQVVQILKGHTESETIRLHKQYGKLVSCIPRAPL